MTRKKTHFLILAVDDEPKALESVKLALGPEQDVLVASSGEQAMEVLSKKNVDLVLLDIQLPGMSGLEVLKKIKDAADDTLVVMLTASDSARTAVQAMKAGAFDYIPKPFDPEELTAVVEKAREHRRLSKEVVFFRSEVKPTRFENLVRQSRAMEELCALISKVAATDVTVLVQGESGTGKELVARAIHFGGARKDKPFVALNCAGIPEALLETELFGHEKGAFTGADRQKPGKFELADGGTLFLDEVSSLRLDLQGKILRALQQREIERVGGTRTLRVDIRVLAATNVDLAKAVKDGKFREDLFYRLNVVPVVLPPLRKRREDIPLLFGHFVALYRDKHRKSLKGASTAAIECLMNYSWPGNVRELENLTERLVVLSDKETIDTEDLPFDVFLKGRYDIESAMDQSLLLRDAREGFEREFIRAALERHGWNQAEAARVLGIHRNTLLMKSDQLGLKRTPGRA